MFAGGFRLMMGLMDRLYFFNVFLLPFFSCLLSFSFDDFSVMNRKVRPQIVGSEFTSELIMFECFMKDFFSFIRLFF